MNKVAPKIMEENIAINSASGINEGEIMNISNSNENGTSDEHGGESFDIFDVEDKDGYWSADLSFIKGLDHDRMDSLIDQLEEDNHHDLVLRVKAIKYGLQEEVINEIIEIEKLRNHNNELTPDLRIRKTVCDLKVSLAEQEAKGNLASYILNVAIPDLYAGKHFGSSADFQSGKDGIGAFICDDKYTIAVRIDGREIELKSENSFEEILNVDEISDAIEMYVEATTKMNSLQREAAVEMASKFADKETGFTYFADSKVLNGAVICRASSPSSTTYQIIDSDGAVFTLDESSAKDAELISSKLKGYDGANYKVINANTCLAVLKNISAENDSDNVSFGRAVSSMACS